MMHHLERYKQVSRHRPQHISSRSINIQEDISDASQTSIIDTVNHQQHLIREPHRVKALNPLIMRNLYLFLGKRQSRVIGRITPTHNSLALINTQRHDGIAPLIPRMCKMITPQSRLRELGIVEFGEFLTQTN